MGKDFLQLTALTLKYITSTLSKLKTFIFSKIQLKDEMLSTYLEEIVTKNISNKWIYTEYLNNSYNSTIKTQFKSQINIGKDLARDLKIYNIQMIKDHMKEYWTLFINMEIHIKITVRYHSTPIIISLKKAVNTECWLGLAANGRSP